MLSYPFPLPCIVQQFSAYFVVSCSHIDVIYFNIIHSLSFSSFSLSLVSSNSSTFGNMSFIHYAYICVYVCICIYKMLVLVFGSSSTYERKHATVFFKNVFLEFFSIIVHFSNFSERLKSGTWTFS
jgi:hypothetical protein